MMLMSAGVAIFHTVIIIGLWEVKIKPKWLFFFLNPSLIALAGLVDTRMGAFVAIILFISVFVFGILGIIIVPIIERYKKSKKEDRARIKNGKKPIPWWKKAIMSLSGLAFFIFVFVLGPAYVIILLFIILPFLTSIFRKTNKKKFYKIQRVLPTANVRSVAMGLAEISGKAKTIEPIISRLGKKECIGYLYIRENVTRNDKGHNSYSLEFSETICNPFFVKDKTGEIKVLSDEIEFVDFEIDIQYQSSMKRYTQYILQENMEVLLIGKAGVTENNTPVFQKEEIKNVFGIAPADKVKKYNDLQPLLKSAGYFIYFWVILIALILFTPIHINNNTIEFGKINFDMPFQNSNSVNSVNSDNDEYEGYEQEGEAAVNVLEAIVITGDSYDTVDEDYATENEVEGVIIENVEIVVDPHSNID